MQNKIMIQRTLSLICTFFLMIAIFVFSAQPREESNEVSSGFTAKVVDFFTHFTSVDEPTKQELVLNLNGIIRKCAHFSIYAALGIAAFLFVNTFQIKEGTAWFITLAICLLYASSDEFHQLFVPGRGAQLRDVMLDFCGSVTGSGIMLLIISYFLNEKRIQRGKTDE